MTDRERWASIAKRARAAAQRQREQLVDTWRALTPCEQAELRAEFADDADALALLSEIEQEALIAPVDPFKVFQALATRVSAAMTRQKLRELL